MISRKLDDYCSLGFEYLNVGDPDRFEDRHTRFVPILISSVCTLIRDAILVGNSDDACHFHDRLFRHFGSQPHRVAREQINTRNLYDAIQFANILIVGWCSRFLTRTEEFEDSVVNAAERLLAQARTKTRDGSELIRIWEVYYNEDRINHDNQLGNLLTQLRTESWKTKLQAMQRTMVVEGGWLDERWRADGFRILLASTQFHGNRDFHVPSHVSHYFWDLEKERTRLEELLQYPWMNTETANTSTEMHRIMTAIRMRAAKVRSRNVNHVATSALDQSKVAEIRDALRVSAEEPTTIFSFLEELGTSNTGVSIRPDPSVRSFNASKDHFIETPIHSVHDFAGLFVRDAQSLRTFMPIGTVERFAPAHPTCINLENVRDLLEKIVATAQFSPNLIVIPNTDEFSFGLFQNHEWQRREENPCVYFEGTWNGINVVSFPYSDPHHVLILDTRKFFTKLTPTELFQLEVVEPPEADVQRVLELANGDDPGLVPSDDEIQVICNLSVNPEFGIAAANAGLRIPLEAAPASN